MTSPTTDSTPKYDDDFCSDSDTDPHCVPTADEWMSANADELFDLYEEIFEILESRFAFKGSCYAPFAQLCHQIYADDLRVPFRARLATLPQELLDLEESNMPAYDDPVAKRRMTLRMWCHFHNDIIRGTYDMLAPDLLDAAREYTHGYMETWASFIYNNIIQ